MTRRLPRPFRPVLAVLLALLTCAALAVVNSSRSTAASSKPLRPGLGYHVAGGDFVGFYVTTSGTKVYCIDPGKAAPRAVSLRTLSGYPGLGRATTAALTYALTRWGDARNPVAAAAESQVVNTLAGNEHDVHRRAAHLPARVREQVAAHVHQARALAGPYSVHVSAPVALLPGQSARGTALVTSASGYGVGGVHLRMTSSANGSVPRSVTTDAHGRSSFSYRATDVGTVRITASATLPAARLHGSTPKAGVQRMVSWAPRATAAGSASFHRSPSGFSTRYSCSTTCDGRPVTSVRACAPAGRAASRIVYHAGSHSLVVNYPAGDRPRCAVRTVRLADGDRLTATWQYRTAHGWSRGVVAKGGLRIDCPPVPAVHAEIVFDCSAALVRIDLAAPATGNSWRPLVNRTRHRMVLLIGGAASQRVYAAPGQSASFTASVPCTRAETFTAQGGVQRTGGGYNYGPTATVTTPKA